MNELGRMSGRLIFRGSYRREASGKYDASLVVSVIPLNNAPPFDVIVPATVKVPDVVGIYKVSATVLRFGERNGRLYVVASDLSFEPAS